VFDEDLTPTLDRIGEWSHIHVTFWLDKVIQAEEPELRHQGSDVGVFAARSPIHPNPLSLTLVELIKREGNVLGVRGLDAFDGTPVVDFKPYPDWERRQLFVVTEFRVPGWLTEIMERHG